IGEVAEKVRLDQAELDAEEAEEQAGRGERECRRIADQHEQDHAAEHQRRHVVADDIHCCGRSYLNSTSITCSSAAMRLMISEMPCSAISPKPIGSTSLTGQRMSPPAFDEPSPSRQDSTNQGQVNQVRMRQIGSRNRKPQTMSIQMRVRSEA